MNRWMIMLAVSTAVGIATAQGPAPAQAPKPNADPYANNPDAGKLQFPLAAPAGRTAAR